MPYGYDDDWMYSDGENWDFSNTTGRTYVPPTADMFTGAGGAGGAGAAPAGGRIANLFNRAKGYVTAPGNFGYSFRGNGTLKPGLTAFGKSIGPWATAGMGIMQGINAAQGLSGVSRSRQNISDLKNDILTSAASNPLVSNYLTADQKQLLNQIRNGTYASELGDDVVRGIGSSLSDAASGALMGAVGGLPGVLVGGIGGLINGGISGARQGSEQEASRLQALYDALAEAETSYQSMRRPVFTGLGIQRNYQNMYA